MDSLDPGKDTRVWHSEHPFEDVVANFDRQAKIPTAVDTSGHKSAPCDLKPPSKQHTKRGET